MNYKYAYEICRNTCFPVSPLETVKDRVPSSKAQTHTHEFTASTEFELNGRFRHNHRFAGVTGEAIPEGRSHIHKINVNTSFNINHYHEVIVKTGPAIIINPKDPPDEQLHTHYIEDYTTVNGAIPHDHLIRFSTLPAQNQPIYY